MDKEIKLKIIEKCLLSPEERKAVKKLAVDERLMAVLSSNKKLMEQALNDAKIQVALLEKAIPIVEEYVAKETAKAILKPCDEEILNGIKDICINESKRKYGTYEVKAPIFECLNSLMEQRRIYREKYG